MPREDRDNAASFEARYHETPEGLVWTVTVTSDDPDIEDRDRRILEMRENGKTLREIARDVGLTEGGISKIVSKRRAWDSNPAA